MSRGRLVTVLYHLRDDGVAQVGVRSAGSLVGAAEVWYSDAESARRGALCLTGDWDLRPVASLTVQVRHGSWLLAHSP